LEVVTIVLMKIQVVWDVTSFWLVNGSDWGEHRASETLGACSWGSTV